MTGSEFAALCRSRLLRLDGATGTELAKQGMPPGICPELWVSENPQAIIAVQTAYAAAGSDIVYAPTFGGNPAKLAEFGLADRTEELNRTLAEISRKALPGKLVFGDIAPTGAILEPAGTASFEETVNGYKRQIRGLLDGGVDGFAIETMMDLQEARAALIAVREMCDLPAIVTLTFEPGGKTLTGTDPVSALVTLQALGADAFGCNCSTGPDMMAQIIAALKPYARIPLVAKANAGMPRLVNDRTVFELEPEEFAHAALALADAGANLIGGCCGTSPAHIAALNKLLGDRPPMPVHTEFPGVVASASAYCRISPDAPFALIGERINPTGKKALQAELREGSLELVKNFALEQCSQGAKILDVNLGLAGIDETDMMRKTVSELVRTVNAPLCIDSTKPETVEAALRLYPGRALFNSVSLEKERIEKVLPIAAKYGAMLILLPLTDEEIPCTLDGRIAVLEQLLKETDKYGYDTAEIVADALVMTISAAPDAAAVTMDFIAECRKRKLNTTCGLSNVSFGLPQRAVANLTFLGMAMGRGLNSAIANPSAPGIADAVIAADALIAHDENLSAYLGRFAGTAPATVPAEAKQEKRPPELLLKEAVLNGRSSEVLKALEELLAVNTIEPGKIVNEILIPAITEVGGKFERKEYFLPQLMQSAAAMQSAMEKLEPLLKNDSTGEDGPVFVLATVKGDIHDIGKNIVALLLRNYHFNVLDLGKDVPAETIVETALKNNAAFIGLSALMTTTMPQMRVVAELARSKGFTNPIIVGGAAVDEAFAETIGAVYAADAMATVRAALTKKEK
ncbi:MAG: homocysteine S-methyltransferase family protein [Lentisphaeria bacterium]|nr:homocysteine S-methyltransferase family protein [Lentisphaeria bacterium]